MEDCVGGMWEAGEPEQAPIRTIIETLVDDGRLERAEAEALVARIDEALVATEQETTMLRRVIDALLSALAALLAGDDRCAQVALAQVDEIVTDLGWAA